MLLTFLRKTQWFILPGADVRLHTSSMRALVIFREPDGTESPGQHLEL